MVLPIRKMSAARALAVAASLVLLPVVFVGSSTAWPGELSLCRNFSDPWPPQEKRGPILSKGKFLVASKNMRDPRFVESVLLVVDYSSQGAMALIINRPTQVKLSAVFPKMTELKQRSDIVYFGGPVSIEQMFLLMRSGEKPEEALNVFGDVYVSSSRSALHYMAGSDNMGKHVRVYAGYAGWSPQQLDREVIRGDWHVTGADPETIFERRSSEIWPDLIRRTSGLWVRDNCDLLSLNPDYLF